MARFGCTAAVVVMAMVGVASGQVPGEAPVGSVVAWLKSFPNTPALPDGWVECNGQVLDDTASPFNGQTVPDLNGSEGAQRFLRGATTSGSTGGSETHTHGVPTHSDGKLWTGGDRCCGRDGPTEATSTLPTYYEVVWIMNVSASPGAVPAISDLGIVVMLVGLAAVGGVVFGRKRREVAAT